MLTFCGVSLRYGEVTALDGLNLEVRRGELLTLLGPSGCGKTTTLRAAGGFVFPDAGKILLDGADITSVPPHERPTATVFQSHALFPHMSVEENVAYGLKLRGVPRAERLEKAGDMLDRVGLSGYSRSRVQELSGGQQQRVALARALILNPHVLLLDEPLSSLDARLKVKMRGEIRTLQKSFGITALYVTHDQEEALAVSDRVALMNKGRIVQVGTPEEVYFSPADSFAADFIGDAFPLTLGGQRMMIRPNQVRVCPQGECRGTLIERVFMGASVLWVIEWQGQKLRAAFPSSEETPASAGSEVAFRIVY
ncbi:MAG: ABC transporter ATP-binding protein [Pyramidobacter sp.]|nr:ABC transporter ATP-binding protein [Pyramidobacter sp.]